MFCWSMQGKLIFKTKVEEGRKKAQSWIGHLTVTVTVMLGRTFPSVTGHIYYCGCLWFIVELKNCPLPSDLIHIIMSQFNTLLTFDGDTDVKKPVMLSECWKCNTYYFIYTYTELMTVFDYAKSKYTYYAIFFNHHFE